MISVEEAKVLLKEHGFVLDGVTLKLELSLGMVLSGDIVSPIDMPPFSQSAMDGYAICFSVESLKGAKYRVVGEIQAGDAGNIALQEGESVRIFTGACVPSNATAVVMQEVVHRIGDEILVDAVVLQGKNIRPKGEQTQQGDIALTKGTRLTAAGISFLAGLGITEVEVYRQPTISIVSTGNELVPPGHPLEPGQIYESNTTALASALESIGFGVANVFKAQDSLQHTIDAISSALKESDVILISGGISVGDYDFVGRALQELEVETIFYKIRQKPGKPILFGKQGKKLVFALPGNPASSLVCFYEYVLPVVQIMSGNLHAGLKVQHLPLDENYTRKGSRAEFLKAKLVNGYVSILEGQSSSMMHTFALANALVYIPESQSEIRKGEKVEVHLLPS